MSWGEGPGPAGTNTERHRGDQESEHRQIGSIGVRSLEAVVACPHPRRWSGYVTAGSRGRARSSLGQHAKAPPDPSSHRRQAVHAQESGLPQPAVSRALRQRSARRMAPTRVSGLAAACDCEYGESQPRATGPSGRLRHAVRMSVSLLSGPEMAPDLHRKRFGQPSLSRGSRAVLGSGSGDGASTWSSTRSDGSARG
jgi:hypothetical protein